MKIKRKISSLCLCLICAGTLQAQTNDPVAAAQHTILGQNSAQVGVSTSVRNTHPAAQWFPEAGLGLFIHFGISSVHGGIDLSWAMYANKSWEDGEITPAEYWKLADRWNPERFDAEDIVWRFSARADCKDAILRAKAIRSSSVGNPDGNIDSNSPFFTFDKISVHIDRFLIPFKTLLSAIKSDISDSRVVNFKSVAPPFPFLNNSAINSPRKSSAAVWVGTMTVAQADGGVDDNSISKCDTSHFANAVARGSRESIKYGIKQDLQFLPLFSRSFGLSSAFCLTYPQSELRYLQNKHI